MRLTIVPIDNKVVVDNVAKFPLDLSACGIPSNVWALQWYGTEGEIEFDGRPKPPNEEITALPEWALACVGVWEAWTPPLPPSATEPQPLTTGTQTL
jgi:hypothetical protein